MKSSGEHCNCKVDDVDYQERLSAAPYERWYEGALQVPECSFLRSAVARLRTPLPLTLIPRRLVGRVNPFRTS